MTAPMDTPDTAAQVARELDPTWPWPSSDVRDWAKALQQAAEAQYGVRMDEDWLQSWFANAMMRGHDDALRAQSDPAATQGLDACQTCHGVGELSDEEGCPACGGSGRALAATGLDAVRRETLEEGDIEKAAKRLAEKDGLDWNLITRSHQNCLQHVRDVVAAIAPSPLPADAEGERRGPYLIWSNEHRAWWRPNGSGYTNDVRRAGRYTRMEAISWSRGRDQELGQPLPELAIPEADVLAVEWSPPPESSGEQPAAPAAGGA